MLSRIGQVSIPVSDQDRAVAFYTEKLGCSLVMDQPMGESGERWIEVALPEGETHLVLYGSPEQRERVMGSFSNIMFYSSDLAATHRALESRGVTIVQPPTTEFWGSYLIFADPDGNSFLVSGPLKEA
ncbi:MAG: lactoylglutathione lyase [Herpetosiphonaceae bacterium]|nr:MAG: lactoylglutathione lyase [Herpetosiphonaceae bacterium]